MVFREIAETESLLQIFYRRIFLLMLVVRQGEVIVHRRIVVYGRCRLLKHL